MKKLLFTLATILLSLISFSQTYTENFVKSTTYKIETDSYNVSPNDKLETVQYFDGLGRLMQVVAVRQGGKDIQGNDTDIIMHIEYDDFGRQEKEYLPISTSAHTGAFEDINVLSDIQSYYDNKFPNEWSTASEANPYSKKEFEASPLNRVLKQAAPGYDWRLGGGHEIEFDYSNNTSNEVKLYSVSLTTDYIPTLEGGTSSYDANTLYKTITKDENHTGTSKLHTTEEFKDKQGRLVLKRTYANVDLNGNGSISTGEYEVPHDTYYVYDDFGNLTYVLPPKVDTSDGVSSTELSELCYRYKYDYRNRLIEKKIPGKGWEYILYDKQDRPVGTKDKNLDEKEQWLFTKYDVFGRVSYTGIKDHGYDRNTFQGVVDDFVENNSDDTASFTMNGLTVNYDDSSGWPSAFNEVLTVNYYDDYNVNLDLPSSFSAPNSVYNQTVTTKTKGLPTVSKFRVLETDDWITAVTYYDNKSRPIYIYTYNEYLEVTDIVQLKLDFQGKVEQSTTTHRKTGYNDIVTIEDFTYDHSGRLLTHTQNINDQGSETIVSNEYDDLGQLERKNVGGDQNTGSELQSVDYAYNLRGWLTDINDINDIGTQSLFAFRITYNDPDIGTSLFNGNISQTFWRTNNEDKNVKAYTYSYDALNRITEAIDYTDKFNLQNVNYDKNGNILTLVRKGAVVESPNLNGVGHYGTMDNLTYNYDNGNKLLKVDDQTSNDVYGFKDDATGLSTDLVDDYAYDLNGNMIKDENKEITNIEYNHLNLPTEIKFYTYVDPIDPAGPYYNKISYIYDANGTKIEKKVSVRFNYSYTFYSGDYVYNKASGAETLKFISQPEGYIEPKNESDLTEGFNYVYQYKDHLGNIRLSYADLNQDGIISDAPIFYDGMESASGWDSQGAMYGQSVDAYDSSFKHSGTYSARIDTPEGGSKYVHSNNWVSIDNNIDIEYTFSFWAYSNGPDIRVLLYMNEDDETGYSTQIEDVKNRVSKNKWVYTERTVLVPSNIDKLNIRIESFWGTPGSVWYDEVEIRLADSEILEENNYYPFGLEHKGYNNVVNGTENNYKTFQGQETNKELGLNWITFKWRNYNPEIGRFMTIDPLAEEFVYNSPYNFAENRVIDGVELEGLEWENFMSGFKKTQNLQLKPTPSGKGTQNQSYNVVVQNPKKALKDLRSTFRDSPQDVLNSDAASFRPIDKKGNDLEKANLQIGSDIEIDIDGPMNNSAVRVTGAEEGEDGSFSFTFGTLEGHVEAGNITFSANQDEDGNISFSINSVSKPDVGLGPEKYMRRKQKESWLQVLTNVVNYLGGTESSRSNSAVDQKDDDKD